MSISLTPLTTVHIYSHRHPFDSRQTTYSNYPLSLTRQGGYTTQQEGASLGGHKSTQPPYSAVKMGGGHSHKSLLDIVSIAFSRFHYLATATLPAPPRSPVSTMTVCSTDDIILQRGPLTYA